MGGNLISFVKRYQNVDFFTSLKILSDYSGIQLTGIQGKSKEQREKERKEEQTAHSTLKWVSNLFCKELPHSKEGKDYLSTRGIDKKSIDHFKIGIAPNKPRFLESKLEILADPNRIKQGIHFLQDLGMIVNSENGNYNRFRNRLIFPIQDLQGGIIGFGGRLLPSNQASAAKYINSSESAIFHKKEILFHVYQAKEAIRKERVAILVEGYFDVLGLWQVGIENVVATMGTAFTKEQASILRRYADKVILWFDGDPAGVDAAWKAMQILRKQSLETSVVLTQGNQDPFDIAQEVDQVDLLTILDSGKSEMAFTLWYYLEHLHSTAELSGKRRAVQDLFQYIRDAISSQWEQEEYLKHAATILQIRFELLQKDFGSSLKKRKVESKPLISPLALAKKEKEILATLIRYPELWNDQILKELEFKNELAILLYTYLKDQFYSEKLINWENATKAVAKLELLQPNLGAELSGLLLEFESAFTKDPDFYRHTLYKNIMIIKQTHLINQKRDLEKELAKYESLEDEEKIEKITWELTRIIGDLKKIADFNTTGWK